MGVINLRTGEQISYADGGSADQTGASNLQIANSIANLMKRRERGDYVWANAGERTGQTGMMEGDRGRQKDTKTEWLFDNSQWRLATPYIEFTGGNQSIPDPGTHGLTGWSVDNTRSTDTTMCTVSNHGITFVRAGLYFIQMKTTGANATGALQMITAETPPVDAIVISGYVGSVSSLSLPYRITADGSILYTWFAGQTTTISSRVIRITRLG